MVVFILLGFLGFIISIFLAIKTKEFTNKLLFKSEAPEWSYKSSIGDFLAIMVLYLYTVVMFKLMPMDF